MHSPPLLPMLAYSFLVATTTLAMTPAPVDRSSEVKGIPALEPMGSFSKWNRCVPPELATTDVEAVLKRLADFKSGIEKAAAADGPFLYEMKDGNFVQGDGGLPFYLHKRYQRADVLSCLGLSPAS